MMEDVKPTLNPYNRLNVIETKLKILEIEEKELNLLLSKYKNSRENRKRLDENTSEQFYLIIEQDCLKNCINWFEIYILGFKKEKEILEVKGEKLK